MLKKVGILAFFCLILSNVYAQVDTSVDGGFKKPGLTAAQQMIANTGEDLLSGNNGSDHQTVISGYGEASFQRDFGYKSNEVNLRRAVLFFGHQFNRKIAFFSELEIEDGKVEGGKLNGTVGMEQAFLKFSLNPRQYIVAGLFLPRIGILNENHLPINFNGVERPLVEQFIIPSTWREIGVGFYSQLSNAPISYSIAVVNGLNAGNFTHGTGIAGGRGEGQLAAANAIAFTASAQAYLGDFKINLSGYAGGTNQLTKYVADSLHEKSGLFNAPIYLGEADIQYTHEAWNIRALGAYISYPDADRMNTVYANNSPKSMYGAYLEIAYNFFNNIRVGALEGKQLIGFVRGEKLNMNATIPTNGIIDPTLDQTQIIVGLEYLPMPNVVVKADVRIQHTGDQNRALFLNPPPVTRPYPVNNQFLNLGVGYSF